MNKPATMKSLKKPSNTIKNWAVDDRPREKLLLKGAAALSDAELLAILINTGMPKKSAVDLAKDILNRAKNNLNELGKLSVKELMKTSGIGEAKAIRLAAALELGRRRQASSSLQRTGIRSSLDIAEYLKAIIKDYAYEIFGVVYLNRANKIKHFEIISKGGITGTVADPRVILKTALEWEATALVLCHNHPSGNLTPSKADEEVTKKIREAAGYLDIQVLDHIIVSEEGYYSFADEGKL